MTAATPVAVPQGDAWWTYRCKKCGLGIRGPDIVATVCPHLNCKVKEPKEEKEKDESTAAPTSALNLTFTKTSIETERRIGSAGPGGDLPLPKQDQESVERVKQLEDEITTLKNLPGKDCVEHIATREKELRKLKVKPPVQEAQDARDGASMLSVRAELEEKRSLQKIQIEAKIQKAIDRQVEIFANGVKEKKALDDYVAGQKQKIDENVRSIRTEAENECKVLREQLDAMEKEVRERKAKIQERAGILLSTSATSTAPAPAVGAVSIDVAPGYLLHSSNVDRTYVQSMLADGGIHEADTGAVT